MFSLKRILRQCDDISEGIVYLVEAFDDSGEIVIVKMTEEEIENGGIDES